MNKASLRFMFEAFLKYNRCYDMFKNTMEAQHEASKGVKTKKETVCEGVVLNPPQPIFKGFEDFDDLANKLEPEDFVTGAFVWRSDVTPIWRSIDVIWKRLLKCELIRENGGTSE